MDPTQIAQMMEMFASMAKSNQELAAAVQANVTNQATMINQQPNAVATAVTTQHDSAANVALTNIKVPFDTGDNSEEMLVNFHEWKEVVNDKLKVAGVRDERMRTTIALMWGGKEIKDFAVEKANVRLEEDDSGTEPIPADTWDSATKKIETTMEKGINESFAMFKFRQEGQGQRSVNNWYKQLRSSVKTLRLSQCTCGLGYSEDRAIRDVMIELTNDDKLRKDGLSKDLSLQEVVREGEANELARARAATVQGKSVNKVNVTHDMTDEEANFLIAKLKKAGKYSVKADKDKDQRNYQQKKECDRCTNPKKYPHSSDNCFFRDKICRVCQKVGHMGGSKKCTEKTLNRVVKKNQVFAEKENGVEPLNVTDVNRSKPQDFADKDNWVSHNDENIKGRIPQEIHIKKVEKKNVVKVKVGGVESTMFADSGSDCSVVPSSWYSKDMGKLQTTDDILTGYGDKALSVAAKFWTTITTTKGASTDSWVYVVDGDRSLQPLLGDDDATELGFLTFHPDGREPTTEEKEIRIQSISKRVNIGEGAMPDAQQPEISDVERTECWEIVNNPKYETIFDGHIGTMKNRQPIVFHADENKKIHSQPYRPVPPQFHTELSQHLDFLRENNKIVDVEPNTEKVDVCSNLVITRKNSGKLRMNIDARPINTAMAPIVTPHMATPEEVRHQLSGSTRFTEFDMNHGYNQSMLSEESSQKYGVFQSHEGFHRFKGLYFGHSQATHAFNEDVKTSLRGLAATESVADNILIHSKTAEDHKSDLISFLDRCVEEGITLSKDAGKATVCEDEVLWFGHVFGKNGVRPDPAKVRKLKEKGLPECQEDVRSFLQAAQFNSRAMWNTERAYSDTTEPLRRLLGKGTKFVWGEEQQKSYNQIIEALESAGALYPYNPDLEICHVADAQPSGIASSLYMLTKGESGEEVWWPLNHTSRSLTKTEMSYPQIDRESLAQSWGMKQHRFYLLGRSFVTCCDHKPLLPFYNGTKRPTPRIEKHILTTQDLTYTMKFLPGKQNPTDWNSRHPNKIETWSDVERRKHGVDEGEEIRLNRVIVVRKLDKILKDAGIIGADRCSEEMVREVGEADKSYKSTLDVVMKGHSGKVEGEYKCVAAELSVGEGFLLKEGKMVIPKGEDGQLRRQILQAAHEGHPGMSRVKSRLRDCVYWPGFSKDVEAEVKPCLACQATSEGRHHKDKLKPSEPPEKTWTKIGADHWGPLPDNSGRHILVVQDYLTKYPEALVVSSTASKDNIWALEEIFGRHGYPEVLITDNGPPWNGKETHAMQQYLQWGGVKHNPTRSADDPEANGLAERLMQLIGKSWETAYVEGTNPLIALNTALKTYRNTEHSVTGRKPAEWLFGRIIRTRLPDVRLQTQHEDDEETKLAKGRMRDRGKRDKERRDRTAREEELAVGMKVLLKNKVKRKGIPKYDPKPFIITELVGRQAVIKRDDTVLRRETQKFKRFHSKEEGCASKVKQKNNVVEDDWEEGLTHTTKPSLTHMHALQNTAKPNTNNMPENDSQGVNDCDVQAELAGQNNYTENVSDSLPRRSCRPRRAPDRLGAWETK